jgi:membrane fusion protein, multidrug efflux system
MKRILIAVPVVAAAAACSRSHPPRPAEAVPVSVATVVRRTVPVQVRNVGTVQPITSVAVKAQVGGELTAVHFREGQDVRKGDPLFTVDERPYRAALAQSEAAHARDRAQAENAAAEAKRYADLVQKDYVTREQYDQVRANAEALAATVRADEAAVENARLQLAYCTITSPMEGRTGSLLVQAGNVVKANDVPLVTINQISPIYLVFSAPEQQFPEIRRRQSGNARLRVDAESATEGRTLASGELTFIDNAVDRTTGTIALKATFRNADRVLWPGEFVTAVLTLQQEPDAVVAPTSAVQTGQQGDYAYVVRADNTAELRPVKVGHALAREVVITSGLSPGDRVVTDGQLRLLPGSRVEIKVSADGRSPS